MILLPAIDIMSGKPVRLYQGDFNQKTEVGESVTEIAKMFAESGAEYIHMVDLDGARTGTKINAERIIEAANAVAVPVEAGGGIRTMADISFYLDHGIARVILGTAAIENEELLKEAIAKYGERIAVGIDCRDGIVCGSGWLTASQYDYLTFAKKMEQEGVRTIIFTDVSRDGTLTGPNLEMLRKLKEETSADLIASGGVHTMDDLKNLQELGVYGAITGKAVYAGTIDLKEAVRFTKGETC